MIGTVLRNKQVAIQINSCDICDINIHNAWALPRTGIIIKIPYSSWVIAIS